MKDVPMTFSYRGKFASEMSKKELCCIILEQSQVVEHLNAEILRLRVNSVKRGRDYAADYHQMKRMFEGAMETIEASRATPAQPASSAVPHE